MYSAIVFGRAFYAPDEDLPAEDTILSAEADVVFSVFDDASGTTNPANPCDQTIEDVGGTTVYRIEKSDLDGTPQEGMLYVSVSYEGVRPYAVSAKIDLSFVTPETYSYLVHTDFTGVLLGFVYWPENTGVFLFFRDDGTKRITIAGPSTDGIGTRDPAVETTVVFDWSADQYTYLVVIDPSVYRRRVLVFAEASDGTRENLADLSLDDFNEFLDSVRMGNLYASDSPDKLTMVVGIDPTDIGNYIDIYSSCLYGYGIVLVTSGSPTGASDASYTSSESVLTIGSEGVEAWIEAGSPVLEITTAAAKVTSEGGEAGYSREEPDLQTGEWLLLGRMVGVSSAHPGTYVTGMGVSVEDGTRGFFLRFLDDFAENMLGFEESDADEHDLVSGYKISDTDWEDAFDFEILGSLSRDQLRLSVDAKTKIDHTYTAAGWPVSSSSKISFGFIDSGDGEGDFYLVHLWLFPNCTFFEGEDATYPEAQGWTRVTSGSTRALADDKLEIDATTPGSYDIYYVEDATYDTTSGAVALFRATVSGWTDVDGAASPSRKEFGPVAAIRTTTVATQVFFVRTLDGAVFVYLSHEGSDVSDVLAQNEAGRAISHEVDLSEEHDFVLEVKPSHHIRLYMDLDPEPVIEVEWIDAGLAFRSLPTNMPAGAVVAVGSLGEEAGVSMLFSNFRASLGRGYDFTTTPVMDDEVLQEHVYGALAQVVIDVQDED